MEKRDPFAKGSKDKGEEVMFIGGYFPPNTVYLLRLYAVYKGQSLQRVLQTIVDDWWKHSPLSSDELVDGLVEQAIKEWERRISGRQDEITAEERQDYLDEIETILAHRKIHSSHIEEIIDKLEAKVVA